MHYIIEYRTEGVLITNIICKLSVSLMDRFLVVGPTHQGSSPKLDTGYYIFLDLF